MGRVSPTKQEKGTAVNDDPTLEKEAEEMGERASSGEKDKNHDLPSFNEARPQFQGSGTVQKQEGEYVTMYVHMPRPVDKEQFMEIAEMQLFGRRVNADWRGVKDSYSAEDIKVPIPVKVSVGLITGTRGADEASVGVGTDDMGRLEGAEERAERFKKMQGSERAALMGEIDRRYRHALGLEEGGNIKDASKESGNVAVWNYMRDEVLAQRQAIMDMPDIAKKLIRSDAGGIPITPAQYAQMMRILHTIRSMDPMEVEDYVAKVTGQASSLDDFEQKLNAFIAQKAEREAGRQERESIKTKLYGMEDLYKKYKSFKGFEAAVNNPLPVMGPAGMPAPNLAPIFFGDRVDERSNELTTALQQNGFASIAEFEQFIASFEAAFRQETINIAFDMLAKYEHVLYEQEQQYKAGAHAEDLRQKVSASGAAASYEAADKASGDAFWAGFNVSMSRGMDRNAIERQIQYHNESKEHEASGDAAVRKAGAETHPLVSNEDFKRKDLAKAGKGEVRPMMLEYIADRRRDIQKTRQNLSGDPDLIFKLDQLLSRSYQIQGIDKDSVFDMIISDRIRQIQRDEMVIAIAVAVFAIALGILTFGGGTVATVAAVGGFALSTQQALAEIKKYNVKDAAYGAQLLEDAPGIGWVILAVVGAGIDLGAVMSTIRPFKTALVAFQNSSKTADDLVELELQLVKAEEKVRHNIMKAARAEAELREAVGKLGQVGGALKAEIFPGSEAFAQLIEIGYLLAKKKVYDFKVFLGQAKAAGIIDDISNIEAEKLKNLKAAFEEGKGKHLKEVGEAGAKVNLDNIGFSEALNHVKFRDFNVARKKGIGGCHDASEWAKIKQVELNNYSRAKGKSLNDPDVPEIIIRSESNHPSVPGVKRVEYSIPAIDGKLSDPITKKTIGYTTGEIRNIRDPKTLYDPQIWTDPKLEKALKEAVLDAKNNNGGALSREWSGATSEGYRLRGYAEGDIITSFFFE